MASGTQALSVLLSFPFFRSPALARLLSSPRLFSIPKSEASDGTSTFEGRGALTENPRGLLLLSSWPELGPTASLRHQGSPKMERLSIGTFLPSAGADLFHKGGRRNDCSPVWVQLCRRNNPQTSEASDGQSFFVTHVTCVSRISCGSCPVDT